MKTSLSACLSIRACASRPLVRGLVIGDGAGEFERAHEHRTFAAHRMGGLRAETARFDAVKPGLIEPPLRQRVHRAARVAESAEYMTRALHDNREIDAGLVCRLALANAGNAENEQQISFAAVHALETQPYPGRLVARLPLATRAAVGPIHGCLDRACKASMQIAVAGAETRRCSGARSRC